MHTLPESVLLVTEDVVRAYAKLTQDFNPLHLDPVFAATTPMGSVVAHGTMSINLIWQSVAAAFGASALEGAELDIRFVKPARIGETLLAGGRRSEKSSAVYAVWVREQEGEDRIVGRVTLPRLATAQVLQGGTS